MGGAIPGLVLGFRRKQAEQAWRNKPISSTPLWPLRRLLLCLSSCPHFLQWWTVTWKCKLDKPFPPQLALVQCFSHSIVTETKRVPIMCESSVLKLQALKTEKYELWNSSLAHSYFSLAHQWLFVFHIFFLAIKTANLWVTWGQMHLFLFFYF